jgi:Spy/CpxP family protein refolding chaperone
MTKKLCTKSWIPTAIAACIIMLLGTHLSFAEEQAKSWGRQGQEHKAELFKELNLTAEQEAKLAEYRKQDKAEAEQNRTAMKEAREKLREELDKPTSDMTVVGNLANTIKQGQAQMVDHRIKSILQLKEVLTPEQFQKFQEKTKEKMKERGQGHGMMPPPEEAGAPGPGSEAQGPQE